MSEKIHNPLEAAEEGSIVKSVAINQAEQVDMMDKPLALHYDYASKLVDGLKDGWGYKMTEEVEPDVIDFQEVAKVFDSQQLEYFMQIAKQARIKLDHSIRELESYIDDLEARDTGANREELKQEFEDRLMEIFKQQEDDLVNGCIRSGRFKYRTEELAEMISSFLVNKPNVSLPRGHNKFLLKLYNY